mmetsp:Transcript_65395/g.191371  ORF Transcript_65395/g.191371 Transcript_65395/m.191371 type:complete len:391 (-) Transcript_65395:616-1788(-)
MPACLRGSGLGRSAWLLVDGIHAQRWTGAADHGLHGRRREPARPGGQQPLLGRRRRHAGLDPSLRRLDHLPGALGGAEASLGACALHQRSCPGGASVVARLPDLRPARHGGAPGCELPGLLGEGGRIQLPGRLRQVLHGSGRSRHPAEPHRGGHLPAPHPGDLQGAAAPAADPAARRGQHLDDEGQQPHRGVQGHCPGLGWAGHDRLRALGLLPEAGAHGLSHAPLLYQGLHHQRRRQAGHHPSVPRGRRRRGLRGPGEGGEPGLPLLHGHTHLELPFLGPGRLRRGGRDPAGRVRRRAEGPGGRSGPGAPRPGGGLRDRDADVLDLRLLREPARRHLRRRRQSSHRGQRLQALGRRAKGHRHGRAPPALRLPAAQDLQRLSRRVRDEQV